MNANESKAEAVEVGDVRNLPALAPHELPSIAPAMNPLALMSDQDFDTNLELAGKLRERVAKIQRAVMKDGVDYGVIPGTSDKPTILKPGCEILNKIAGLVPVFDSTEGHGDGVTRPMLSVVTVAELHVGSAAGPIVCVASGSANSWEKKYRYRYADLTCPACKKSGSIIKGRQEYGGGWVCYGKKGGCGAKWDDGAPEIEKQPRGQIENPDQYDLANTIRKMSEKRALAAVTLIGNAASGLFTQDPEDMDRGAIAPVAKEGDEHPARPAAPAKPANGDAAVIAPLMAQLGGILKSYQALPKGPAIFQEVSEGVGISDWRKCRDAAALAHLIDKLQERGEAEHRRTRAEQTTR